MNTEKLKKLGNKIYALARKIEEAEKNGMVNRIETYKKQLKEVKDEINQILE